MNNHQLYILISNLWIIGSFLAEELSAIMLVIGIIFIVCAGW